MKRVMIAVLFGFVAAACGGEEPPAPPTAVLPPQTPIPRPASSSPDQCGAKALQYLIGKPRSAIPASVEASKPRVTCTSCPMTMDYREDRLNILFDAETEIIKAVRCG